MHSLTRFSQSSLRRFLLSLILGALAAAVVVATPHHVLASGNGDPQTFTITASSANVNYGYILYINNSITNNQPNLNLQVTQVWPSNYDAHPIGVWYDGSEWTIFNEDIANIPLGTSFNVSVHVNGDPYFQVTATTSNSSGDSMYINNAIINNTPNAKVWVTQDWTGTYDPHEIGVWYDSSRQQWAVFNEDGTAIPAGSTFELVLVNFSDNFYAYTQTATAANSSGYITFINDPALNNNPNLFPRVTQVWDAQGSCGCVFNNHPIGVWYDAAAGEWTIYNVDIATIPVGAAFFVSGD